MRGIGGAMPRSASLRNPAKSSGAFSGRCFEEAAGRRERGRRGTTMMNPSAKGSAALPEAQLGWRRAAGTALRASVAAGSMTRLLALLVRSRSQIDPPPAPALPAINDDFDAVEPTALPTAKTRHRRYRRVYPGGRSRNTVIHGRPDQFAKAASVVFGCAGIDAFTARRAMATVARWAAALFRKFVWVVVPGARTAAATDRLQSRRVEHLMLMSSRFCQSRLPSDAMILPPSTIDRPTTPSGGGREKFTA
jgi:hypothetical protein